MEETPKVIEHEGTVSEIDGNKATVRFIVQSACAHCQLKGVCSAADMENKEVEVDLQGQSYRVGEKVNVVLSQAKGMKALLYGYLFPFVLVMVTLFAVFGATGNEIASGLAAVAVLMPYYGGLYLLKDRIRKEFRFFVRKQV